MLIPSQRALFEIPEKIAYFNCAYMGPLMTKVAQAGKAGVDLKKQPWTIGMGDFFSGPDNIRTKCAQLINANPGDIALVPSVSYGIATAARNLTIGKGQDIIVLEDQFPANFYSWQRLAEENGAHVRVITHADALTTNNVVDWTAPLLDAIGEKTAILALPHCHWTDGTIIDLVKIGKKARSHGVALVLDITQSAGAMPFDVEAIQPDFLVAASYKWLLGPYATGFLYVAPKCQIGIPLEEGWITRKGSEDFRGLVDYQDAYQPGAIRFDMGERASFHLLPMMDAALDQLLEWGIANIAETLLEKTRHIAERAASLGLTCQPEQLRAGHFLGLRAAGGIPENLAANLASENIYVSIRGETIRVTPHLFNTDNDADRLINMLKRQF